MERSANTGACLRHLVIDYERKYRRAACDGLRLSTPLELPLLVLVFCAGFYAAQRWKLSGSGVITSILAFAGLILAGTKPKE